MEKCAFVVAMGLLAGYSFASDDAVEEGDFVVRNGNEISYYEVGNSSGFTDAGLKGAKTYIEETGDVAIDAAVSQVVSSVGAKETKDKASAKIVVRTDLNRGYLSDSRFVYVKHTVGDARTGVKPDFSKFMRTSCYDGDDLVRFVPPSEFDYSKKKSYYPWGRHPDPSKLDSVSKLSGAGAVSTAQFAGQSVGLAGGGIGVQLVAAFVGAFAQGIYDRTSKGCNGVSAPFFPNSNLYSGFMATGFFKNGDPEPAIGVVRSAVMDMKGLDATPAVENHIRVLKAFSRVDA